jgi:RHS repeat-associated protein
LIALTNESGTVVERYAYDPWGARRNPTNWTQTDNRTTWIVNRGYTGHEHLDAFSIINMNGRVYDPLTAQFFSPDPFVQAPGNWLNFNRYGYCLNNPLKYTDPTGEFWHIIIGGVVGGAINLVMNWDNCDGFWQYAAAFGVGAVGGAATAAVGGTDGGASFWAITGTAAAAGALTSGTNSVIAQTGNNFSGMNNIDLGQVGQSFIIGAVSGFAGSSAGYWAANSSMLVNGINSPIARSAIVSPLAAGAGHIAGGTTAGMLRGQSFDAAFKNSFDGIGKSMLIGTAVGISTTVGMSYAKGMNPLNGKTLWPKNNGFKGSMERTILDKNTTFDRYGDETGRFGAPEGTPFDMRSLPPNAKYSPLTTYKVVQPLPAYKGLSSGSFWFNSSGGGTQYMFDYNIYYLLQNGYIIRVP